MSIETVAYGKVTWTNIEKPTPEDIEVLRRNYNFHPLDLEDCLSKIERPKIDEYEDYLFIVMHFPVYDPDQHISRPSEVDFFIGAGYLVTVHDGILGPIYQLFDDCQRYERTRAKHMGRGASRLLYSVMDALVDYCFPILNKIIANIERVEDDIFDERALNAVQEISILRRDVISFRRINWPLRAVIGSLERRVRRFSKKDEKDLEVYFGDVVDHLDKIWSALDEYKEVIEGLSDTNNSLTSNRINEVMRVLTIFAAIMLPLTVVSSIYGMNVPLPGGVERGNPLSFVVVLVFMALIAGCMMFYFHRKRWI